VNAPRLSDHGIAQGDDVRRAACRQESGPRSAEPRIDRVFEAGYDCHPIVNALVASPGFPLLLDVGRPGDGPRNRSCTLGLGWHPVDLAQPDRTPAGGGPRRNRRMRRLALLPGWRVVALREIDGMPYSTHLTQAAAALVAGHPGDLPARRGHFLVARRPCEGRVPPCKGTAYDGL